MTHHTSLKVLLATVFAGSIVTANVTASKVTAFDLPVVGLVTLPAGFVALGVAFLCSDLMGELYGKEYAKSVVNASIGALVVAFALIYVAIAMPPAPFYELSTEYSAVLGGGATIITASIITVLVSQNLDVYVFHTLKSVTDGEHKWLRNLGSTSISQFVDTALFIVLGFSVLPIVFGGEITPWGAIPMMILGQYVAKLVVAALETPIFYVVTYFAE